MPDRKKHNTRRGRRSRTKPARFVSPELVQRYRPDGTQFHFADVLNTGGAREAFHKLCAAGCDRKRLTALVMGFHLYASPKAGLPAFQLSKKQVRTLNRLDGDLEEIENWRPFPAALGAEGEHEGLWYRVREFHENLRAARRMHDSFGKLLTVNARDFRAACIVRKVRQMTSDHEPHYDAVRALLNGELAVSGDKDFYNSVGTFEKAVTKQHFHANTRTPK